MTALSPQPPRGTITATVTAIVIILILMIVSQLHAADIAAQRAALCVVRNVGIGGQGSGVCFSSEGLVLTAGHCAKSKNLTLEFDRGPTVKAVPVYVSKTADVAVLRAFTGESLPSVPVAAKAPEKGEPVWSLGYPAGQFAHMEGKVKKTGPVSMSILGPLGQIFDRRIEMLIETDHQIYPGNSGGPLFNANGELCGIGIRSTDGLSQFVHTDELHKAIKAAAQVEASAGAKPHVFAPSQQKRPTLYIFGDDPKRCPPCGHFKKDFDAPNSKLASTIRSNYTDVWKDIVKDRALAAKYRVDEVPTVVPEDGSWRIVGYENSERWIAEFKRHHPAAYHRGGPSTSGGVNIEVDLGSPSMPPTRPDFVDPPRPQLAMSGGIVVNVLAPNWENVDIVVSLPEGSLGEKVAKIAAGAKRFHLERKVPIGEFESKVAEMTDGKARPHLVTERFSPTRYGVFNEAMRLDPERISVVALVKDESSGFRGHIHGVLQKIATAKIGDISLHGVQMAVVFSKVEPAKYQGALDAVTSSEPQVEESAPASSGGDPAKPAAPGEKPIADQVNEALDDKNGGLLKWLLTFISGGSLAGAWNKWKNRNKEQEPKTP